MGYKISSSGSGVHNMSQAGFQKCRAGHVLEMPSNEIVGAPHVSNNGSGAPSDMVSAVSGDAVQPFNNEDNSSPLALSPAGSHHSARMLSASSLKRRCLASQCTAAASTGSVAVTGSTSLSGPASEDVNITAIICSSSQMSMVACVNGFRTNLSPSHTGSASVSSSSSSSSSTSPPSNSCTREAPLRPPPHGSPQQTSLHESCQLSSPATCLLSLSSSSSSSSSVSSLDPEQGQGQSQGLCEERGSMLQGRGAGGAPGGVGGGGGSDGLGLLMSGALMSGILHLGPEAGALLEGGQRSAAALKQEPLDDFSPSEDELFQHHYHHHMSGRSGHLRHLHHPPRSTMPPPYHLHQYVGASPGGQLLHPSQQIQPASSLGIKPTSGGPPGSHAVPEREEIVGGVLADKQMCRWIDCSASYEQQEELVRHIEKVHIDQRKGEDFTCFWAGCIRRYKPFNARYKLLIHMRVHSGEKPNKCMVSHHKVFAKLKKQISTNCVKLQISSFFLLF